MKPTTADKLEQLNQVEWFHAVGKGRVPGAKMVSSWMEAVVNCAASKWETVQCDAMYLHKLAVYDALHSISPEERHRRDMETIRQEIATGAFVESGPYLPMDFPRWDRIREEIKPSVVALVTKKTMPAVTQAGLPGIVVKRAIWDILYMAMEFEFDDVLPESFFAAMAAVYLHGHFPCGWEGNWPDGELLIF